MTLITDRTAPADVPTTNALDAIPADLLGPIPAELRIGANVLLVQEKPPELGEVVTVIARIRITREGKEKVGADTDAEIRHFRAGKIVTAWLKGQPEPPDPDDDDQPALIATDGSIEPETVGEIAEKIVERPAFSNLTGDRDE